MTRLLATVVIGHAVHLRWSLDYAETLFFDGTKVPALSTTTVEKAELSAQLGYYRAFRPSPAQLERAVRQMDWEHDLVHSLLAQTRDLDVSPTLWMVAHRDQMGDAYADPQAKAQRAQEEGEALALQWFVNHRAFQGPYAGTLAALDEEMRADGGGLLTFAARALMILRP